MNVQANTTASDIEQSISGNALWLLTSAMVIITMQSGFGLLESGFVSKKNEINIMIKNVVDITLGGVMFWAIGYGLGFGESEHSNSFVGFGDFFFDTDNSLDGGWKSANYFFQLTFSTTATTIVSGALAERCRFRAYCLFALLNTLIYCVPAHWVFSNEGWLKKLGAIDFAGAGPVHLLGGTTALIGAWILGPRLDRNIDPSSVVNSVLGLFLLAWGWLGFNCGSSFGVSEGRWILVARAASSTLNAMIGGNIAGLLCCIVIHKRYDVFVLINTIISALVAITPCCAFVANWASILIGMVAGFLSVVADKLMLEKIDDPIGCVSSHGASAVWGLIATALFVNVPVNGNDLGLFYSGSFRLLGVQCLEIVAIIAWAAPTSCVAFKMIDKLVGLRLTEDEEKIGNDCLEHLGCSHQISPRIPHPHQDIENIGEEKI